VNGTTINLDFSAHDTIYLDCDLHDAYYEDGSSANAAVSFSSTLTDYPTFPGLLPGDNTISVSSENTVSFEIVPRWWVL
jgi:phage-related protein